MNRRNFLQGSAMAVAAQAAREDRKVRIGIIGTGNRGKAHLGRAVEIPWVEVTALCDTDPQALASAQDRLQTSGRPKAEGFTGDVDAYRKLVAREDLDAVIIATPWQFHAPMAVAAMKARKWVGVEVPAAQTVEECRELLRVSKETGTPCMMLENWSFRRDNLAVLNMIRQGLFGEIVHCHCAHGHDCINSSPWYFDRKGNVRWGGQFLIDRDCDQYPTHSLGPVLSWMNINCGDALDTIVSMSSRSLGI
ncbi:MAG: Gfo/Idh/MocA family oxidoreductase, partial [Acidobacteria bacterium]|nr:Gfo/Idh/MocA family oxidoreductase [Acidobacteriota bacterium]